ncbi:mitochondrial import receptor subunit TOM20 homolog [Etheostoma cragini]|uniref:mitochondrial import receptor subunit TOM20 homolog n=1 Tax=Etheostoma cragini TaxID=417921 RepID=UPI00155DFB2D|nr:mitochondrial import receptor subunit TOM20 homolog [Etheostoma cragini]
MMGGKTSALAAGLCGALLLGYCIYFDKKRRSDPDFKNRLRERRRKQKVAKERAGMAKLPDLKDAEAVQKFFLEEIQLGEELLAQGKRASSVTRWCHGNAGLHVHVQSGTCVSTAAKSSGRVSCW